MRYFENYIILNEKMSIYKIVVGFDTRRFLRETPPQKIRKYMTEAETLSNAFDSFFAQANYKAILICPGYPRRAPLHREMYTTYRNMVNTVIWNSLGLPVCTVPMGTSDGLPVSVQLVAAQGADALLAAFALALEKKFGGWCPP